MPDFTGLTTEQVLVVFGFTTLVAYVVVLIYGALVRSLKTIELQGLSAIFSGISLVFLMAAFLGSRHVYLDNTVGSYAMWVIPMLMVTLFHICKVLTTSKP